MSRPQPDPVDNLTLEELLARLTRCGFEVFYNPELPSGILRICLASGTIDRSEPDPRDDMTTLALVRRLNELGYQLRTFSSTEEVSR